MKVDKIIKSLLIIEFSLFLLNASNYLMLLNTEYYKYYLLLNSKVDSIVDKFNFQWGISNLIFYLMFILAVFIIVLTIYKYARKKEE
mgnify:CR=1 FL=1